MTNIVNLPLVLEENSWHRPKVLTQRIYLVWKAISLRLSGYQVALCRTVLQEWTLHSLVSIVSSAWLVTCLSNALKYRCGNQKSYCWLPWCQGWGTGVCRPFLSNNAKHFQPQLRVPGAKVSRKGECLTCHSPWKVLAESDDHGAVGIHRCAWSCDNHRVSVVGMIMITPIYNNSDINISTLALFSLFNGMYISVVVTDIVAPPDFFMVGCKFVSIARLKNSSRPAH